MSSQFGILYDDPTFYRKLCGALQCLTFSHPDIPYTVQQIFLFMHAPLVEHMSALKVLFSTFKEHLILAYICLNHLYVLFYLTQMQTGVGVRILAVQHQAIVFFLVIIWFLGPLSGCLLYLKFSAEAEYRGVAKVVLESCWVQNLLLGLHCRISKATLVYCDNVSAIYLSSNPVQHQRTKHNEMDIHFVCEKVQQGEVRVLHVPSRNQIAHIFTKSSPRVLFDDFRDSLNVRRPTVSTLGVW